MAEKPKTDAEIAAEDMLGEDLETLKAEAAPEARLHPILSDEDFRAAQAKAKSAIEKERRTAAMASVVEQETQRLRVEEGLTTGIDEMDEIVNVTIDLPPYTDHLQINGVLGMSYWHGKTYDVPRHVANSINEQMHRCWRHEDQTEGRDIRQQYGRKRETSINARSGAIHNAPARIQ